MAIDYMGSDNGVIWLGVGAVLVLFSPWIVAGLKKVIDVITNVIGGIIYLNLLKKEKAQKKVDPESKIQPGLTHNIQRSKRKYIFESSNGELISPFYDETIRKYNLLNSRYPEMNEEAYKRAKDLDMAYFVSDKYPLDYIVIGHRAALETARKGSLLTEEEEALVWLGYGYDGRPFGEPWGLEDEMLDDYLFAESEGDFLTWLLDTKSFDRYLKAGYEAPRDPHETVNRDNRVSAERRLRSFGNNTKRITQERFETLKQKDNKKDTNVRQINQSTVKV